MKTTTLTVALCFFLGMIPQHEAFGQKFGTNKNSLQAGIAKINITPETPIVMSGYGNRKDPFKGVHDSIFATAVVFSDGTNKALILTADLIGFSHEFVKEFMDKAEKSTGIDRKFIMLTATHNHGGPSNRAYRGEAAPEVEAYTNALHEKLLSVAENALKGMQPARVGVGTGKCTMNINRRARLADGTVWLGRNPDGPCDHDVTVVKIEDQAENPMAVMVNWPCHGTVSGQDNYEITGDWPGAVARHVEKAFDGKVVVPVTAGASGDINPIYGPNTSFRDINAIGMMVGEEVEKVAQAVETSDGGKVEAAAMTIRAKGKKPFPDRSPNHTPESNEDVDIQLSVIKVGTLVFAGISGEAMTEIGMKIKAESPYRETIIFTHCNGNSGYLCTDPAYPEGGYEPMVSRTMPGTADLITENLGKMIRSFQ